MCAVRILSAETFSDFTSCISILAVNFKNNLENGNCCIPLCSILVICIKLLEKKS